MKKNFGISLWISGLALFAWYFAASSAFSGYVKLLFVPVAMVYSGLLIYNWLWGHQKGHIAHLISIIIYALLGLMLNFAMHLGIIVVAVIVFVFAVTEVILVARCRRSFVKDYRCGVSRNYFQE